ncbi:MAG: hypothetical protein IJ753_03195 [Bacteroidales bacterium]|nr:hypothetical protein [Bacteroidales bacterium]
MKKIISVFLTVVLVGSAAFAQNNKAEKKEKKGGDWREKVRAEQVAGITAQLDLSEAEAQAFWPVYNEVQKKRREAFKASAQAYKALNEGIEGNEVNTLLEKYLDSKKAADAVETEAIARYKKVLPVEKVAKLIVAEENFRHQQIGKLGGKAGHQGPGGPRPGGNRPQMPPTGDEMMD